MTMVTIAHNPSTISFIFWGFMIALLSLGILHYFKMPVLAAAAASLLHG